MIQIEIGPIWDTFDFLSNAFYFAGQGFGYMDLTRPPFLPFLTSLFFRLGFVSDVTIYAMDGVFFVFGVIGLYLFFKLRFNSFESFFGSILFISFPLVLVYVSMGLSDMASVSLSIWSLFFTVLAVRNDSKFFYLAFPFLVFAFLTRYPAALIIFPMVFYLLINRKRINYKNMIIGMFLGFLTIIPVFVFFFNNFGNPVYPFITMFGFTQSSNLYGGLNYVDPQYSTNLPVYIKGESVISSENPFYNDDLLYFIKKFPFYVGAQSFAVLLIGMMGIYIYGWRKLKKGLKDRLSPKKSSSPIRGIDTKILTFMVIITLLLFIGTFGKISYMFSEFIFFIFCYLFYVSLKKYNKEYLDIDFLFLLWLGSFFIFHSVYVIKDDRYFITMAPAVSFFLIIGFSFVINKFGFKYRNLNLTSYILSSVIIVMLLFSTVSYLSDMSKQNGINANDLSDIVQAANWLKEYDPAYKNKTIYADHWPYFSWYLKTDVKAMPAFKNNKTYYYRLTSNKADPASNILYNKELSENNVDYYFSYITGLNLTSYKPIKQFGLIILYERISDF